MIIKGNLLCISFTYIFFIMLKYTKKSFFKVIIKTIHIDNNQNKFNYCQEKTFKQHNLLKAKTILKYIWLTYFIFYINVSQPFCYGYLQIYTWLGDPPQKKRKK